MCEVKGKIKVIDETVVVGNNGFRKRDIVITTDEQYPQDVSVQFVQDKCDILDNFKVGQDVKINVNLRGREWINPEGVAKYFNTIQGWRIEFASGNQPQQSVQPQGNTQEIPNDGDDDLPF